MLSVMNLRAREAPQRHRCEDHWRQRRGELFQFFAGRIEFAAFVAGADDENAQVVFRRKFHRRPVRRVDVIPMQVHVFEARVPHAFKDRLQTSVSRETDVAYAALFFQFQRCVKTPAFAQRPIHCTLGVVQSVQREEVDVIEFQQLHRTGRTCGRNSSTLSVGPTLVCTTIFSRAARCGRIWPSCSSLVP